MPYTYAEEHGGGHHSRHLNRMRVNRELTVHREMSVAESEPRLAPHVGKWLTIYWTGRRDEIKVVDRVTRSAGRLFVRVERKYPYTGGVVPVTAILASLPKPSALMIVPGEVARTIAWEPNQKTAG